MASRQRQVMKWRADSVMSLSFLPHTLSSGPLAHLELISHHSLNSGLRVWDGVQPLRLHTGIDVRSPFLQAAGPCCMNAGQQREHARSVCMKHLAPSISAGREQRRGSPATRHLSGGMIGCSVSKKKNRPKEKRQMMLTRLLVQLFQISTISHFPAKLMLLSV